MNVVRLTAKGMTWIMLGFAGLIFALASGRAELAVLGAPFIALIVVAAIGPRSARVGPVHASVEVDTTRCAEGDRISIIVTAPPGSAVRLDASSGVRPDQSSWTMPIAGGPSTVQTSAQLTRWGMQTVGPLRVRRTDDLGAFARDAVVGQSVEVRVLPRDPLLDRLVRARRTRAAFGNLVTRALGPGIEFAEVRPMQDGDMWRDVNWRASARREHTMVNVRHAERAADVILFVDTFSAESLTMAVRAAGSLARAYLAARDRVGLVALGGTVTWHALAGGRNGLEGMLDALLRLRVMPADGERDLRMIPRGAIPTHALVIALSPFLDTRMVDAIGALRRRGHDILAVELLIDPPVPRPGRLGGLAAEMWEIEREHRRRTLQGVGVPVLPCADTDQLGAVFGVFGAVA